MGPQTRSKTAKLGKAIKRKDSKPNDENFNPHANQKPAAKISTTNPELEGDPGQFQDSAAAIYDVKYLSKEWESELRILFQHLPVSMVDNLVLTADDLESKMDASVKYILKLEDCEEIMKRAAKRGRYSQHELREMTEHVKTLHDLRAKGIWSTGMIHQCWAQRKEDLARRAKEEAEEAEREREERRRAHFERLKTLDPNDMYFASGLSTHMKTRPDIEFLATALGVDKTGTMKDLRVRIKQHLRDHPELEKDNRFVALYSGVYGFQRRIREVAASGNFKRPVT
ncbi:hypothetical protein BD410DRAFT_787317 [Rickenella mellea]|uniref:Uncharacterized protein n=1 Tax=Rickenella mellea TaxID=50990 RepID=A0A4Y7Q855_9AGAM|nr:hypothetical protein BD410DRAFT_787317 [Rickenella mellea]